MSKRSISLVLGSGGARGLAHIGVIEVLEEQDFDIQSIAGCSMGALVGGVYAMGKLPDYKDWVCALERTDVLKLLDFSFGSSGLIKGDRIIDALRAVIGDQKIEDLPIAFTAVATDLDARREVWLGKGSLFDAIRASIAVPTILTPSRLHGRTLVDGGLLNPVPIGPTLRDQTELTFAVDLAGRRDPELPSQGDTQKRNHGDLEPYRSAIHAFVTRLTDKLTSGVKSDEPTGLSLFEVVNRSFDVMQGTVSRLKLAAHNPDLVIEIPRNTCLTYEYYRAAQIIEVGRRQAERALKDFKR